MADKTYRRAEAVIRELYLHAKVTLQQAPGQMPGR